MKKGKSKKPDAKKPAKESKVVQLSGKAITGTTTGGHFKSCHTTHPVLKMLNGEVVGARCGDPRPGFDIYVGFDYNMKMQNAHWPWKPQPSKAVEFLFHITDMCAPKSAADLIDMVTWLGLELEAGKRVHMGCIGGHGRTGLVLATMAHLILEEPDPIAWVRANHCKKAVESAAQIKFLVDHFKIPSHPPTKTSYVDTQRLSHPSSASARGSRWATKDEMDYNFGYGDWDSVSGWVSASDPITPTLVDEWPDMVSPDFSKNSIW